MLRCLRFLNETQFSERSSQHNVIDEFVGHASRIRERVCSCPCVGHKLSEYREAYPANYTLQAAGLDPMLRNKTLRPCVSVANSRDFGAGDKTNAGDYSRAEALRRGEGEGAGPR